MKWTFLLLDMIELFNDVSESYSVSVYSIIPSNIVIECVRTDKMQFLIKTKFDFIFEREQMKEWKKNNKCDLITTCCFVTV